MNIHVKMRVRIIFICIQQIRTFLLSASISGFQSFQSNRNNQTGIFGMRFFFDFSCKNVKNGKKEQGQGTQGAQDKATMPYSKSGTLQNSEK